jgi:hypothetical protein
MVRQERPRFLICFRIAAQLFLKHFMMGPGAQHQCVGCTLEVDHLEGILTHLEHHDVSYVAVARAPIGEIEAVRKRNGWIFPWVSSYESDFNYDFNVSFTRDQVASGQALYNFQQAPDWAGGLEDLSGDSVFYKDDSGQVLHTYSTFGRGGEQFLGIYGFLCGIRDNPCAARCFTQHDCVRSSIPSKRNASQQESTPQISMSKGCTVYNSDSCRHVLHLWTMYTSLW